MIIIADDVVGEFLIVLNVDDDPIEVIKKSERERTPVLDCD
jgi:hypothetical protein